MDASALERAIHNLEIRSESLDSWLTLWITLVVIGLVVEVWVVVFEHFEWWHFKKRSLWKLLLQLIGPVLITIGVAGELGVHSKSGTVNTGLRNATKTLVGLSDTKAEGARERAAKAEREAGYARRDAETARKNGEQLKLGAEKLKSENLGLQSDVLKLREKMADRHLTVEQQERIAAKLKPFARMRVNLRVVGGNGETITFANEIATTLGPNGAKWIVSVFAGPEIGRGVRGVLVEFKPNAVSSNMRAADALVLALDTERLSVKGPLPETIPAAFGSGTTDPKAEINIIIGTKP